MGPFDKNVKKDVFDNFKAAVQLDLQGVREALIQANASSEQAIAALRAEVAAKTPESEAQVHEAAAKAQVSLNKLTEHVATVEEWLSGADQAKLELDAVLDEARHRQHSIADITSKLMEIDKSSESLLADIKVNADESQRKIQSVTSLTETLAAELEKAKSLPASLAEIAEWHEKASQDQKNIQALMAHAMKRKSEIDDLHKEILGYEVKDTDGKVERVDGLKDVLSHTYEDIEVRATGLRKEIDDLVVSVKDEHLTYFAQQQLQFKSFLEQSDEKVTQVRNELTSLLPGALAEGLSAAYEGKKNDETLSLRQFEQSFSNTIMAMIAIAAIPFAVDAYLLVIKERDLVEVIKETPRLIAAILPLYLPVLWLAYSTNKKINLAKRLIEEYTHKAVLGKTFSGLANQIESLPKDGSMREELRGKLLFNLLDVSAENPGKLISDYNKADHPLLDALENSSKLSTSMEALSKIPGMSSIVKVIESRAEKALSAQATKVADGLSDHLNLESKS